MKHVQPKFFSDFGNFPFNEYIAENVTSFRHIIFTFFDDDPSRPHLYYYGVDEAWHPHPWIRRDPECGLILGMRGKLKAWRCQLQEECVRQELAGLLEPEPPNPRKRASWKITEVGIEEGSHGL